MDLEHYDEFGNYIGPELPSSDSEESAGEQAFGRLLFFFCIFLTPIEFMFLEIDFDRDRPRCYL